MFRNGLTALTGWVAKSMTVGSEAKREFILGGSQLIQIVWNKM